VDVRCDFAKSPIFGGKLGLNRSTASHRTRFTVEPPNPPPIILAPKTPGDASAASTRNPAPGSHFVVVTQASVRFRHQPSHFRQIPRSAASAKALTRAFSVMT